MKYRFSAWLFFTASAFFTLVSCVSLRAADEYGRSAPSVIRGGTAFQGGSSFQQESSSMRVVRTPAPATEVGTNVFGSPAPCEQKFQPLPWGTSCDDMGCCGPDACCPQPCSNLPCYPPPRLYARFGAIALTRDGGQWKPFASLGELAANEDPDVVLSSDNIEFPYQGGGELTLGWGFVPRCYLEFDYFELTTWDKQVAYRDSTANSAGGTGTLFSPFGGLGRYPLDQFDYNNYAFLKYRSNLNNYELNLRHQLCMPPGGLRASVLFGGRTMRIYEGFEYETTSNIPALGGTANTISTSTRNRLLGLQVGGMLEFHADPCWWINVDGKAGICQNKVGLDSVYVAESGAGGSATYHHRGSQSSTTCVGEIGVSLVYEQGPHLTWDVGYRAMWLTGLALAPQNLQTDAGLLVLGPVNVNTKSDVVYHGPHAGLTVRW